MTYLDVTAATGVFFVTKCYCGNEATDVCYKCDEDLCDEHNFGDELDQCCLCENCKDEKQQGSCEED